MAKKAAPAKLTGGAGFRYEDQVAARLLLDMLGGTNSLGEAFGRVAHLDWQARDAGWHVDDLALQCVAGTIERAVGLSIKSDRQVTASGFPPHFVTAIWEHWLALGDARPLRREQDAVVLITGPLAAGVDTAWQKTLREALETTPERMAARLTSPSSNGAQPLSSEAQRALFASLRCPSGLQGPLVADDAETVSVLRQVRLLHFDYESPISRDTVLAIRDAQRLLVSGDAAAGRELWRWLIEFAAEQRATGGATDLPKLLTTVRGRFTLVGHPDYSADWQRLTERSVARIADVRDTITGLGPLPRDIELGELRSRIGASGVCLITGESGCGKSAIAKQCAQRGGARVVWFEADDLRHTDDAALRHALGLANEVAEILLASPTECLVVFDGIEHFSLDGLRVTGRLIRRVRAAQNGSHVRFLLTCQAEASGRITRALVESGADPGLFQPYQLDPPSLEQIREVLRPVLSLRWASFRPELQELLTNLKVLDLVVQAARTSSGFDPAGAATLSSLIDRLWERWIEGDEGNVATSHLLMQLGVREADSLAAGAPRIRLGFPEQQALPGLVRNSLVRLRDERVLFTHDLLGDWARLRVCVGEDPTATPTYRERAASPRWHRAVRLFGQRLLELEGVAAWREALRRADDGTDTGTVIRDLLLEGVFLAGSARSLFTTAWPILAADEGRLLCRLLDRLLIVATLPDPRLSDVLGANATRYEHLYRIPLFTYWGPVLATLHACRTEVARLAPGVAARGAALWLRTTPAVWDDGRSFPWRKQAAEIALAVAREFQARREEGDYPDKDEERAAYESALLAAADSPDEVAELCLELAQRRDLRSDVRKRVAAAEVRAAESKRLWREENPARVLEMERLCRPILPQGELLAPWPAGPRQRVADAFQDACLNSGAFICLCRSRPAVAREVLLAVCIEEPKHDDPYECYAISENCGVEHWFEGYPPLYDRGPFLAFLRERPEEAIDFTLQLINFATHRSVEAESRQRARYVRRGQIAAEEADDGIAIDLDGSGRQWFGNPRVFRWHHDWPHESRVVTCCLMALEFWLYERIERGEDVTADMARLLVSSESLAFAGLLVDAGKRYPQLLTGVLRPLLGAWELYDLDLHIAVQNQGGSPGLIGWSTRQPADAVARAREWFLMPHRQRLLRDLAQWLLIREPEMRDFFAGVRANWSTQLRDGEPHALRLLVERLDPANYIERLLEDGRMEVSFRWPEDLQRGFDAQQQEQEDDTRLMLFPWHCRQRLNRGERLAAAELPGFWESLLRVSETDAGDEGDRPDTPMPEPIDATCAGVAVLLCLHPEFVTEDPERERWCREVLERVLRNPPRPRVLESESAIGNRHWDAFVAEAGVAMLAKNARDQLARRLVARGVMAYRYATGALCFRLAFDARERLGPDFSRLVHLAVEWAAVRALLYRCQSLRLDTTPYAERAGRLEEAFVAESLGTDIPSIVEANRAAQEELVALVPPECRALAPARRGRRHVLDLGLDGGTLQVGLGWLDLRAATNGDERRRWLSVVRDLLTVCLGPLPKAADPQYDEFEGLPGAFDRCVFQIVSHTIRVLGPGADGTALWQPLLDLPVSAHKWVEQFFWSWFPDRLQDVAGREVFFASWVAMIRYAVAHPGWDPATNRQHYVGDMVIELLGFHFGMESVAGNDAYAPLFQQFADDFDRAAARWCVIPRVAYGYARFLTHAAATALLLPLLGRLSDAIRTYDNYDWRERGLEDGLVNYLRACWEKRRTEVSSDDTYRRPFLAILAAVTSRGNHAATAFSALVVEQVGLQV